ncbi:MAG: cytochrome oxidase assembly protein [Chloroflexi bacterium HGW-Chloroflexi-6]|nr:MAG: cytochrome oxidase assembly protein [Chloroflexi bacterium HGW-Chloroflexi-6]
MTLTKFSKFSWVVLGWTILVILWGALVRATGSGAGCGNHWPTCNGDILHQPQAIETFIELTHRAMSGGALILVLIMLIWAFRAYLKGNIVRKGAVGTAAFILLEALLGAGLVLLDLVGDNDSVHRAIAVALHLLNTFLLLGIMTLTAWWASGGKRITFKEKGLWPVWFLLGLAGVAIIGMTGAVTALGDTLFPARSLAEGLSQDSDPNAHFLIRLRVIHPIVAVLVGVYTLNLVRFVYPQLKSKTGQRFALALAGMILIQWTAGLVNVVLLAPIWMQLLHLFLADLVWIFYVLLAANVLNTEA